MNEEVVVSDIEEEETKAEDTEEENAEDAANSGKSDGTEENDTYFRDLMENDIRQLREEFAELRGKRSITELENPIRYAALRDMGLSPAEAYLATSRSRRTPDTRAHLSSAVPRFASTARGSMSDSELSAAREIFTDMSDSDIRKLYKKVTL